MTAALILLVSLVFLGGFAFGAAFENRRVRKHVREMVDSAVEELRIEMERKGSQL